MALAYLSFIGTNSNFAEFIADIGCNKAYKYKIGKSKRMLHGIEVADDICFESPLYFYNEGNALKSDFTLNVPLQLFDRQKKYIQLFSFKNQQKGSPAISGIIEVVPTINLANSLSARSLHTNYNDMNNVQGSNSNGKCRSVSFSFVEQKSGPALFDQDLRSMVESMKPAAEGFVKNYLERKKEPGDNKTVEDESIQELIENVIDVLKKEGKEKIASLNGKGQNKPTSMQFSNSFSYTRFNKYHSNFSYSKEGGTIALPVIGSVSVATLVSLLGLAAAAAPIITPIISAAVTQGPGMLKLVTDEIGKFAENASKPSTPATPEVIANPSLQKALSNAFSAENLGGVKLSKAQVVEVGLAGLLSALAALQGGVVMNRLADTPDKFMEQQYLTNLLAETNKNALLQKTIDNPQPVANSNMQPPFGAMQPPPGLPPLPFNLPLPLPLKSPLGFSFSKTDKINISFQKNNALYVNSKPRYIYNKGIGLTFLLNVNAVGNPPNRPIPKVIVEVLFKSVNNLVLYKKTFKLKDVFLNNTLELNVSEGEAKALPLYTDIIVSANFIYKSKNTSTNVGTTDNHLIYLVQDYYLKTLGENVGAESALADMNKYRVFWNKIWEGGAGSSKRWKVNFDAKYYLYYRYDVDSNGRIETRIKAQKDEDGSRLEIEGKLKAGLEISPNELNKLITQISSYAPLNEKQLNVFRNKDFQSAFNLEAVSHLELKGKDEQMGMIWAFPEFTMQKFVLNKVQSTDKTGQIVEVADEDIYFPKPTSIHFVGLKTLK